MNTSTDNWRDDPNDVASAISDVEHGTDGATATSPLIRRSQSSLGNEAVADFEALSGYWNRIIVQGMVAPGRDFLPDILIV